MAKSHYPKWFHMLVAVALAFGSGWFGRALFVEPMAKSGDAADQAAPPLRSVRPSGFPDRQERLSAVPETHGRRHGGAGAGATARERLAHAAALGPGDERDSYLRELVESWIHDDLSLSADLKESLLRSIGDGTFRMRGWYGESVQLSLLVAMLGDPEIRGAWKDAHALDPERSEIVSMFASEDVGMEHPGHLLDATAGWTPWERSRYRERLMEQWALKNPEGARARLESSPAEFGTAAASIVYQKIANTDFKALEGTLESISEPGLRQTAIAALALSLSDDTKEAIAWADSLASAEDRDAAHGAIYQATPRGIGVTITMDDGFPQIHGLIRNDTGLLAGDRIAAITEEGGKPIDLYGLDMDKVLESLRGTPGTEVSLNILRPGKGAGALEQHEVKITRQQLILAK